MREQNNQLNRDENGQCTKQTQGLNNITQTNQRNKEQVLIIINNWKTKEITQRQKTELKQMQNPTHPKRQRTQITGDKCSMLRKDCYIQDAALLGCL